MVLIRIKPEKIKIGQVMVFKGSLKDPIIHRVIKVWKEEDKVFIQTKGDNNSNSRNDELKISADSVYGRALFRIPWLGYVKITFVNFINILRSLF